MPDQQNIEKKIDSISTDIVQEMEEATRDFIEERGKRVPERRVKTNKVEEEPKQNIIEPEDSKEEVQYDEIEQKEQENRYSESERLAMSKGWKPKDQYKGEPKDFRSADEFLGRSEIYDKMSNQSRTIREMQEAMKTLTEMNRRQHEMIHKDRLEYFEQQKKAAIELASPTEVEKYEKAIQVEQKELETYKKPEHQEESTKARPQVSQDVKDFLSRNQWFNPDPNVHNDMKDYAIFYEQRLIKNKPELSESERLFETEKMVKKVFSENFENRNRGRAPSVNMAPSENVSLRKTIKKKHGFDSLPSDIKQQVRLMAKFTHHNGKSGITLDDYAEQLYETGVLKDE